MKHFAMQAIDGRWHTVYRIPACGTLHSVADCTCEHQAKEEADRRNALHQREEAASLAQSGDRTERPIPAGFYDDADAS